MSTKNINEIPTDSDRELYITRLLNAPIDLVFEVWTNPEHIKNWWGPNGFTNTIFKMDMRAGGEWDFIMHGPDGTDYKNTNIFAEVIQNKSIVYDHVSYPIHRTYVTFEAQGEKTLLSMRMVFESFEFREKVVKEFGAAEGLKQNISKLEEYLNNLHLI